MSKIKVKTVTIDINGKKLELTLEEARELHKELGQIFNTKTEFVFPPNPIRETPIAPRPWRLGEPMFTSDRTQEAPDVKVSVG